MGLSKTLGNIGGSVIVAKGRVKVGFYWNCIIAVCNGAVFLLVVHRGTGAIAAVYSALSLVYLLASFRSYYGATIGLTLHAYVRSFALPAVLSGAMALAVFGLNLVLGQTRIAPLFALIALVAFGGILYGTLNRLFMRKEIGALWSGSGTHYNLPKR